MKRKRILHVSRFTFHAPMSHLAIVVVSFNTRNLLHACLSSVFADAARSAIDVEVWVVDNASADGSADMVREQFPQVHLIESDVNLGFAAGNNRALRELGFSDPGNGPLPVGVPRHVLLLNPDTEVRPGAMAALLGGLQRADRAGIAGARLVYRDGSFQHSAFRDPGLLSIAFDLLPLPARLYDTRFNGRYPRQLYDQGRPFCIDHPLGATMLVRREMIQQIGLFDEGFFMYCEEIDWCIRARAAGWNIYCVPQAEVVHHAGQSTRQVRSASWVNLWRSRARLYRKHYRPAYVRAASWLVRLGMAWQARAARQRLDLTPVALAEQLEAFREVTRIWENSWTAREGYLPPRGN